MAGMLVSEPESLSDGVTDGETDRDRDDSPSGSVLGLSNRTTVGPDLTTGAGVLIAGLGFDARLNEAKGVT